MSQQLHECFQCDCLKFCEFCNVSFQSFRILRVRKNLTKKILVEGPLERRCIQGGLKNFNLNALLWGHFPTISFLEFKMSLGFDNSED